MGILGDDTAPARYFSASFGVMGLALAIIAVGTTSEAATGSSRGWRTGSIGAIIWWVQVSKHASIDQLLQWFSVGYSYFVS